MQTIWRAHDDHVVKRVARARIKPLLTRAALLVGLFAMLSIGTKPGIARAEDLKGGSRHKIAADLAATLEKRSAVPARWVKEGPAGRFLQVIVVADGGDPLL